MKIAAPPFGLRMPPDLKSRLAEAAKANRRSLNSEINFRLEQVMAEEEEKGAAGAATPPRHDHANLSEGKGNEYAE